MQYNVRGGAIPGHRPWTSEDTVHRVQKESSYQNSPASLGRLRGVCTPGRIGVSPPAACAFQVKQIMEEAVTRKFVHEDSSHIISFCGESVARGLTLWLLPLWAALGRACLSKVLTALFCRVTWKVSLDPFIRELGNTEKSREEIKHDLCAHEEVIMVNTGGLASSAVGSVHTTLSHAAGVLHLRDGLHVLSSLCLRLVPSERRGWMGTFLKQN